MKIFDYKFIFILGIIFVLYFINKDISDLIKKVDILEENNSIQNIRIENLNNKINLINNLSSNNISPIIIKKNNEDTHIAIYSNDNDSYTQNSNIVELLSKTDDSEIKSIKSNKSIKSIKSNISYKINNNFNYDEKNLIKLKLTELQQLANNLNISIDKNINGNNKNKTKQELINNILEKNI